MDRHNIENGPIHSRQLFAVLVMLWVKLVNLVNFVMQIFVESLKSLKCLKRIFATSATFASANFVGKASCESTEMYRVKSRIPSCYLRLSLGSNLSRFSLASLICLCMLTVGVGNVWGAETLVYTLDGTVTGGTNTYDSESDITQSSKAWKVTGNTTTNPWRIGGKKISNVDRPIYTTFTFTDDISKVTVETGTSDLDAVNSITLIVSSSQNGGGTVTSSLGKTSSLTSKTLTFNRPDGKDWSGKYFTIVFNVSKSANSNAHVQFKNAKFYKEDAPACTSISPSLSYASVGGTTLVVGSTSSGSPTVSGNTGSGAVTYSVTAASPAGCATVNSSTGVVTAVAAGTATITASIAANGGYCSGSATANFTITVPAYTVQFSTGTGNPTVSSRTEASGGAGITLPAGPTPTCSGDGWSFAGWKETSAVTSETTVAPTLLSAGSTFHPTGNVTLYAVYQKADLSTNYAKITSSAALTSGSNYVIARGTTLALDASDYYMDDGDGYFGTTSITVSDNTIANPSADLIWEISGNNTDGYSFYNANQNLYIGYSTSDHDLYADGTNHSDYTITYTSSNFYVKSKAESTNYFATWKYDLSGGGSAYFFEIKNSSAYVVLYKQTGTITYFSNPTCCTPLGSVSATNSAKTGTTANFTWSAVAGAESYKVKVPGSSSHNDWTTATSGVSVTGLTAGNSYTAYFKAFDSNGTHCSEGPESTIEFTTPKITLGSASGTSTYNEGSGPGSKQTFTVTAVGLTGNLTVTAPTNFAVCATESGSYTSSITLTPTSGAVSTTVYFQLVAGKTAAASPYAGNVTVSGGSATEQTVAVNGTVNQACADPTITVQPAASASYNLNVSATALSVTATKNGTGPALTYQWYSNTANSKTTPTPSPIDGATSSSYTPPTTAAGTKYYFCEVSSGACSLMSDISAITVNTPTLSIGDDKTSIEFGDRAKGGSYELTFTVSGSNLAYNTGISLALSGTNASLFSIDKTSISQTSSGAVSSTTVTITYSPNVAGDHTATLTITSTGATSKVLSLSGSSKWVVTWKVNGSTSSTTYVANSSKPTPPSAPADNTLNNCANKFMGWSCKSWGSTPKTTGTGEYDDLFTSSDYSTKGPSITQDTVLYAVFAEEVNSGTYSDGTTHVWTGSTNGYSDWGGSMTKSWLRNNNAVLPTFEYTPDYNVKKVVLNVRQTNNTGSNTVAVSVGGTAIGSATAVTGNNVVYNMEFDHGTGTPLSGKVRIVATNTSTNTTGQGTFELNSITLYEGAPDKECINYVTQCASNQVRVTYNFNGGYGTACTGGVTTKTDNYTLCSSTPTKSYYDFNKWNDGTSSYAAGATGYDLQSNTTFTAQWTPTTYNITYENMEGATNALVNVATYNIETATITLGTPTRGHDRFDGWFTDDGVWSDEVTEIPLGSHGDITLYAKWTERHHIEFFKDGVSLGEMWRAEDENMEDVVAGQGSVPSDPSAPTACSSKTFVGWITNDDYDSDNKPAGLMKPAAGSVDADKEYHAVWATSTSGSKTLVMEITRADFDASYHDGAEQDHTSIATANDGSGATLSVDWKSVNVGDFSSKIQIKNASGAGFWNTTDLGSISSVSITSGTDVAHYENTSAHPTSTSGTTKGYFTVTKDGSNTGKATKATITFTKTISYYNAYATSCCTKYDITGASTSGTAVEVNGKTGGTLTSSHNSRCAGKNVMLSAAVNTGYQFNGWTITGSTSGDNLTSLLDDATSLTPAAFAMPNEGITVEADITEQVVTAWSWTYDDDDIPNPLELYVGEKKTVNVTYTPSTIINTHKSYDHVYGAGATTYITATKAQAYCTIKGNRATDDETLTLTHVDDASGDFAQVIHVKVIPLPIDHYLDLVHGVEFAEQAATATDGVVTLTYTAPGGDQAEWSTPYANTCEQKKVKLVGWVESEYADACIAADSFPTTDALKADSEHFFEVGAEMTASNKTYYAVWAEKE